jgi:hypothetical protein
MSSKILSSNGFFDHTTFDDAFLIRLFYSIKNTITSKIDSFFILKNNDSLAFDKVISFCEIYKSSEENRACDHITLHGISPP